MDINADEDDEQVAEVPAQPAPPPPEIEYGAGTTFVAIFEDKNGVHNIEVENTNERD